MMLGVRQNPAGAMVDFSLSIHSPPYKNELALIISPTLDVLCVEIASDDLCLCPLDHIIGDEKTQFSVLSAMKNSLLPEEVSMRLSALECIIYGDGTFKLRCAEGCLGVSPMGRVTYDTDEIGGLLFYTLSFASLRAVNSLKQKAWFSHDTETTGSFESSEHPFVLKIFGHNYSINDLVSSIEVQSVDARDHILTRGVYSIDRITEYRPLI